MNLENLTWVIPAVVFVHVYNLKRNSESISLSGWSYVFSLVVISYGLSIFPLAIKYFLFELSKWWEIIVSSIFGYILAILFSKFLSYKLLPINDLFIINCNKWHKQAVILSTKNDKFYIGILSKYTENPKSRSDSQMVSIYPIRSGYRKQTDKKVEWNIEYPVHDKNECEIFIPRNEIVTFSKFNEIIFDYFGNKE